MPVSIIQEISSLPSPTRRFSWSLRRQPNEKLGCIFQGERIFSLNKRGADKDSLLDLFRFLNLLYPSVHVLVKSRFSKSPHAGYLLTSIPDGVLTPPIFQVTSGRPSCLPQRFYLVGVARPPLTAGLTT